MVPLPRSLNAQLILLVSCILLVTGAMSGWLTARKQSGILDAAMHHNAEIMTRNLGDRCAYFLVLQDFAGLETFLNQSVGRADILRLQVCETGGAVVASAGNATNLSPAQAAPERLSPPRLSTPLLLKENGELVIWQPIEVGRPLGWLKATYSLAAVQKLGRETWQNSLLLALAWVAGSIALLLLVLRPAVRDIGRLAEFARDLDAQKGAQLPIRPGISEIEELGAALNYASTRLLATEQELLGEREALQTQYSTLRGIVESDAAPIFSLDRQYRYTSFNTTHAAVMQAIYGREIRLGAPLPEFMTVPEDWEKAQGNLDRALAGERFVASAYSGEDARGRLYFEVSHNPIRAGDGAVIGVAVFSRDISVQKQAELVNAARIHLVQFAASHALAELLEETLNKTEELTGSLIGFYHFYDSAQNALTLQAWSTRTKAEFCTAAGEGRHYSLAEAGVWADAARQRIPVIHNEYSALAHRKGMPPGHAMVTRELVVPVMRGGKMLAILGIGNKPSDYTDKDVELVAYFADFAWDVVERKKAELDIRQLNEELEQRVRARTAELEEKNAELKEMNKIFVGRELRMAELKERIRELSEKAGPPTGSVTSRRPPLGGDDV